MTKEVEFTNFLDDSGIALEQLKALSARFTTKWSTLKALLSRRKLIYRIYSDFGLYGAQKLQEFLLEKITHKLPTLKEQQDVTFDDLQHQKCPRLKIVVSDLGVCEPQVYSGAGGKELNGSVIDAVRASMSYPFVFKPVRMNRRFLVDGGLSSNLPIFLFEQERRRDRLPVIAFDLMTSQRASTGEYGFRRFCGDMLSTALESGDYLLGKAIGGVFYVRIPVPDGIETLDFAISETQRENLFNAGLAHAHSFFRTGIPQWKDAKTAVEALQALHVRPIWVKPLLQSFAEAIEKGTPARNIRSHIMLPTPWQTRIVVYQYGMDNDADGDLELGMEAGCSGRAWSTRKPIFADLADAKTSFSESWLMTQEQQNKVRPDRKAMMSIPIFDQTLDAERVDDLPLLGILSVDTDTPLSDTLWREKHKEFVVQKAKLWADILSRILH